MTKNFNQGTECKRVIEAVEEHGDVLPLWVQAGFVSKEVVIFDRHLDYKYTPSSRVAKAKAWLQCPSIPPPIRDLPYRDDDSFGWGIDDFIWVAAELGIINRLVWVMPEEAGASPRAYGRTLLQQLERIPHIGSEVLGSFAIAKTHAEVRTANLCIRATSLRHLAAMNLVEDIHIDFDLDFFVSELGTVSHTIADLMNHFPSVTSFGPAFTACYSESSGFLPTSFRYLSRELAGKLNCEMRERERNRSHLPVSTAYLYGAPIPFDCVNKVIEDQISLVGAAGYSWAAELCLAAGDPEKAMGYIDSARQGGERATIACYKLGLWYMKQSSYVKAQTYLDIVIGTLTDSVSVHALKLSLLCQMRLGNTTAVAGLVDLVIKALPHNKGLLELLASVTNHLGTNDQLSKLIVANHDLRKILC